MILYSVLFHALFLSFISPAISKWCVKYIAMEWRCLDLKVKKKLQFCSKIEKRKTGSIFSFCLPSKFKEHVEDTITSSATIYTIRPFVLFFFFPLAIYCVMWCNRSHENENVYNAYNFIIEEDRSFQINGSLEIEFFFTK